LIGREKPELETLDALMRIVVPESPVKIYSDGFSDNEIISFAELSKNLSHLVEKIEDPLVIALDGQWGIGKSYFLKRWVGAHTSQNHGQALTIYFDAFAHDYLDDPLISLTGAMGGRVEKDPQKRTAWRKVKSAAVRLRGPAVRIGASVATAGLSELVGPAIDSALEAGNAELQKQSDSFWKKEDGRRAAMSQFRSALEEITTGTNPEKLVVVIDELDRCRPDFALSTLEVLKHFFNVENVHFVLGVNIQELQNSVNSRYGPNTNARLYLQKFISVNLKLPEKTLLQGEESSNASIYVKRFGRTRGLDTGMVDLAAKYIPLIERSMAVSLRSAQRILTELALIPFPNNDPKKIDELDRRLIAGLVCQYVLDPDLYRKSKAGIVSMPDILSFLGIENDEDMHGDSLIPAWAFCLDPETIRQAKENGLYNRNFFGTVDPSKIIPGLCKKYVESVKLFDTQ
jgi:hypothetical protein